MISLSCFQPLTVKGKAIFFRTLELFGNNASNELLEKKISSPFVIILAQVPFQDYCLQTKYKNTKKKLNNRHIACFRSLYALKLCGEA